MEALAGTNLFVTGGTGFYGKWLLEAIAAANDLLGARISATLLSRDPARFAGQVPHLALRPEFTWLRATTTNFAWPAEHRRPFDYLLDFATPSAAEVGAGGTALIDATLSGTSRLIEFARHSGVNRVLYASSGAVHGHGQAGYVELKRRSEKAWLDSGIAAVIARGYAFIGPYLPLTDKFAVGAFLRDALAGGPIRVTGNGTAVRSYLYGADLAINLLELMVCGTSGIAHDLGSTHPITIGELAGRIAFHTGVQVAPRPAAPSAPAVQENAYLPDARALDCPATGLTVRVDLDSAIRRTVAWARSGRN